MTPVEVETKLRRALFADESVRAYAVLDGASADGLLDRLAEHDGQSCCLFAGKLHPEVAQTAPYLVELDPASEFADWLLQHGWNAHWGIFALAPAEMEFRSIRKHLRTFLRVRSPDGAAMLFRYYDPRVLRVYLPTCEPEEAQQIFGLLQGFVLESQGGEVIHARFDGEEVRLAVPSG